MFSKMTLSVLISGLSIMADCFSSAAFGCFSLSFFLMSVVMSCFPSILLFWLGSVYFSAKMLAATDRLELLSVPPVGHSILWHDVIQRKKSLCQEHAVLLVVQLSGVAAAICQWLAVQLLPCRLSFVFFFAFFQALLRCHLHGLVLLG